MTTEFTARESALYDRQLRVWGVDVQKRLQRAKILLVGDDGLFCEVAKNLVLAGVGSVSLCTGRVEGNGLGGTNFLANCHPELKSTEACVSVLTEMNPLVSVAELATTEWTSAVVQPFDLVCLMGGSLAEELSLDATCRGAGVKFCCGRCVGPFGWMFLDLLDHSYVADEALVVSPERWPQRLHGLYLVLRVCMEFESRHRRPPVPSDAEKLQEMLSVECPDRRRDARIFAAYLEAPTALPSVCSVLGGMLSNEIIKIVSLKGDPVQNFVFYDVFDGKGILHLME